MTAKPEPEQLYLSEDTAPPSDPAIDRAIKYWREAVGEQADASKTTKQRHGHMLMLMGEGDKPKRARKTAAEADPFGATRGLLDEAREKQANGAPTDETLTPAQAAAKEHYEARTKRQRNGGKRKGRR